MNDEFHKNLEDRISQLELQIRELEKDLIHDQLTGLKTRAFFEEESSVYLHSVLYLEAGKRREWFGFKTLSFVFFDVDNLKEINDTFGSAIANEVLKEVALLINRSVREGDTVAHWGDNRIAVCLLGANESDAKEKARNIKKSIDGITFTNNVVNAIVSAGVATNWKGATFEDMIKNIDKVLNQVKQSESKVLAFSEV